MSSRAFRSVVRRKEHRERHQPEARARFGLLEKHKDYVARAKNFHAKEARLEQLRLKAANRNPDEFYHKMLSSRTKDGVHAAESARPKLTGDMLKVLKTQDKAYVQTMKSAEDKKIEKLRASLHALPEVGKGRGSSSSSAPKGKHTVFLDSAEEVAAFDPAAYFGTEPALLGRTFNRPRSAGAGAEAAAEAAPGRGSRRGGGSSSAGAAAAAAAAPAAPAVEESAQSSRAKARAYAELEARTARAEKLGKLGLHMDLQRALLQKGKRVLLKEASGDAPAVFKWKAERKR
jgi:U3 small nucleolar RNA-associated protein 11